MNTDEHGLVIPSVSSHVDRYVVVFLAAWGVGVFVLHVVTSVQMWDRYLLPLVIPLVLIVAWAIGRVQGAWRGGQKRMVSFGLLIGVVLLCVPPALQAADGRLPIGGDHGAYAGLDAALGWVEQATPTNAVLYHRELGWHERFYLYDAVRRGDVDLLNDLQMIGSISILTSFNRKNSNLRLTTSGETTARCFSCFSIFEGIRYSFLYLVNYDLASNFFMR